MGRRLPARRPESVDPALGAHASGRRLRKRARRTTSSFRPRSPSCSSARSLTVTNHGRAILLRTRTIALRAYLQKGGFLWADDAWGSYAWEHWQSRCAASFRQSEYPLVDLPISHRSSTRCSRRKDSADSEHRLLARHGRPTSERGEDSRVPHAYACSTRRPHHGPDDPQHGFRRCLRARSRRPRVFLEVFGRRLCGRDQHPAVCDDALNLL